MATFSRVKTWSALDTLTAADLNAEFDNIVNGAGAANAVNADNIDETDDYTWTGAHVFDIKLTLTGTYLKPLVIGAMRVWYDSGSTCLRVKVGSDPSSATDGNALMEG